MLTAQPRSILRDGTIIGLIGAGSVGVWFLLVDAIAGRPFFTPAILGSAVFFGLRDPSAVVISVKAVLVYTAFHVVAFHILGTIIAAIMAEVRKTPSVIWLLVEFFIVFEFGFHAAVSLALAPLLAELAWINVALGNVIAAAGMGYYVWRAHRSNMLHRTYEKN